MTKLGKRLTEKTRKFGAEVRRRHSTGLTPESEECYGRVPATFPSDWYDRSGPGCDGFKLKKGAPERAHKELRKYNIYCDRKARKGIIVD
ncbi:hypothetical protein [Parasutterella excrementihominis]|uniref:hypothetical protein n=1 Tax=Parasutterella excrementihominis TaxID=487175 RepID=UPI003076DA08